MLDQKPGYLVSLTEQKIYPPAWVCSSCHPENILSRIHGIVNSTVKHVIIKALDTIQGREIEK